MKPYKRKYTVPIPPGAKRLYRKSGNFVQYEHKGTEVVRKLTKDGKRVLVESKCYYLDFEDRCGRLQTLKAFTNREVSEKLASLIVKLIEQGEGNLTLDEKGYFANLKSDIRNELINCGLLGKPEEKRDMSLTALVDDFRKWFAETKCRHGYKRNKETVVNTCSRIQKIITGCGFEKWDDITAGAVEKYLGGRSIRPKTFNQYVVMFKEFCQWVVDNGFADKSPVAGKRLNALYVPDDEDKRAFSAEEAQRLIDAAENSPYNWKGISGHERAVLYLFTAETGLRPGTLRKLLVGDFDLNNCTVNIRPEINKNRTRHTIYIKQERAEQLREHFKGKLPGVKAFRNDRNTREADMIKADLARTKVCDATGAVVIPAIPYTDSEGRKACFHSLRKTANTEIQRITKDELLTKIIMGHKIPKGNMTALYLTVTPQQIREVIEQLPDYKWPQRQAMAATGTDGKSIDGEILQKSYAGATVPNNHVEQRGVKIGIDKTERQSKVIDRDTHCTSHILPKDEKSTESGQKQIFSEAGEKFLRESCFSDPDLRKIIEIWPDLPEHIKSAIKVLIQAHEAGKGE